MSKKNSNIEQNKKATAEDSKLPPFQMATLLHSHTSTQNWIVQADTKGGFLLTINGVLAGFTVNQLGKFIQAWNKTSHPTWMVWGLLLIFVVYTIAQVHSFMYTALVFVPRPTKISKEHLAQTKHVFNYSMALHFPELKDDDQFWNEYKQLSQQDLAREYVTQFHIDALVCTKKYKAFNVGFRSMMWAMSAAAIGFLGNAFFLS